MTFEEFDRTKWHSEMSCVYDGRTRTISCVSFAERLIGIADESDLEDWESVDWVRCENVSDVK